jgi:hypothetical protein
MHEGEEGEGERGLSPCGGCLFPHGQGPGAVRWFFLFSRRTSIFLGFIARSAREFYRLFGCGRDFKVVFSGFFLVLRGACLEGLAHGGAPTP